MLCPKCGLVLHKKEKQWICKNKHSYDKAKEGYVNLLLKNSQMHGDNKKMVQARSHFLNQGYYLPLAQEVINLIREHASKQSTDDHSDSKPISILDLGCGQGYYTSLVKQGLLEAEVMGIDISKAAIQYASKQNKNIQYVVASNADLPLEDGSVDVALCLFSFFEPKETRRVLHAGGILIVVNPHEEHLFALKQAIYDEPYRNEVKMDIPGGFNLLAHERVKYPFHLTSNEVIHELFGMTPYAYRTSKEDMAKLNALQQLHVEADFSILVYQKQAKTGS